LELVLFRGLQGVGGATITAVRPALLAITLPEDIKGRAFGSISSASDLGLAAGFRLGALIPHFLSWQWIFFINVPFGIVAVLLTLAVISPDSGQKKIAISGFDTLGSVLIFSGVGTGIAALSMGEELGWTSGPILLLFLLSLLISSTFLFWEWRQPFPLIDRHLLKQPQFTMEIGAIFINRLLVFGAPSGLWSLRNPGPPVRSISIRWLVRY
jgi:MFS family permease